MVVIKENNFMLEYDEDMNCIIQTWKGFFNSDYFKEKVHATNKLFAGKRPVAKFIVDGSESSVIKREDTEWAAINAIPIAIQNGLKYYGFVLPKNVFTQVSLKNFRKDLNQPTLEVQIFDSLNTAKAWAKSVDS